MTGEEIFWTFYILPAAVVLIFALTVLAPEVADEEGVAAGIVAALLVAVLWPLFLLIGLVYGFVGVVSYVRRGFTDG